MARGLYSRLFADRYGSDAYMASQHDIRAFTRNQMEYAIPDAYKYANGGIRAYRESLEAARDIYASFDKPGSYEARMELAQAINYIDPSVPLNDAFENAERYMQAATGYSADVDSYWEHLGNTFRSTGSGMMASIRMGLLYMKGSLMGFSEEWQNEKAKALEDIRSSYAMTYNADEEMFNNSIFKEIGIATAGIAPSMMMSLGIAGVIGLASAATGGGFTATLPAFVKSFGSMSAAQKAISLGVIGGRFYLTGMADAGSSVIELAQAGIDDDIILANFLAQSAASGAMEAVGDIAVESLLRPIANLSKHFGKKAAREMMESAQKKTAREIIGSGLLKIGKEELSETSTEMAQTYFGMLGQNLALEVQERRHGEIPEGIDYYTAEDFTEALMETFRQTALGTLPFSFASSTIDLYNQFSEGRRITQAGRYTRSGEGSIGISSTNIVLPTRDIDVSEDSFKDRKADPLSVVRIGGRYIAINPTDEQIYAARNSKTVYAMRADISSEKAIGHEITADNSASFSPMKADTVISTIEKGIYSGDVIGFTFYDSNMSVTDDMVSAAYASIVTSADSTTPVLVRLTTDVDSETADAFENSLFGRKLPDIPNTRKQTVRDARNNAKQKRNDRKAASASRSTESIPESTEEAAIEREVTTSRRKSSAAKTASTAIQEESEASTSEPVTATAEETSLQNADSIELDITEDSDRQENASMPDEEGAEASESLSDEDRVTADSLINEILEEARTSVEAVSTVEETATEAADESTPTTSAEPVQSEEATPGTSEEMAEAVDDDNIITEADTPSTEQVARNEERNRRVQEFAKAREDWESTKRMLTGKDANNDLDVLTNRFREVLSKTKVGKNEKLLDATARSSAIIMSGFMRASGMTGKEYFDSLSGFVTGGKIPYVGENGKIYFQAAYHGSMADFDRFSTDHIGEGEGAQAFGWGLYFSKRKGVARGYATRSLNNNPYTIHKEIILEYFDRLISDKYTDDMSYFLDVILQFKELDVGKQQAENYVLGLIEDSYGELNNLTHSSMLNSEKSTKNHIDGLITEQEKHLKILKDLFSVITEIPDDKWDTNVSRRNLYTVEIPDSRYIKWFESDDSENAERVIINGILGNKEYREAMKSYLAESGIEVSQEDITYDLIKEQYFAESSWTEYYPDYYPEEGEPFGRIYRTYENMLDIGGIVEADKAISNILYDAGYKGIEYPIDTVRGGYNPNATEMNYVIFNEDDVKIVDHIYFQQQEGDKIGWFMSNEQLDRYIGILEDADPTTLSHELGHHFLSVLAPDNPYYQRIASIYRSEFDADGGIFGTNLQEAFCSDLENYIRGRQSSNKQLNGLFQQIYNIAKAIWKSFKGVLGLSPERKALFDSIFGEDTDISAEQDMQEQRAVEKANMSSTPVTALTEELVPEAKEPDVYEPRLVTDISSLGISETPLFTNAEASPFIIDDYSRRDAEGNVITEEYWDEDKKKSFRLPVRGEGIVSRLNGMNLIRFGAGKYYVTNEEAQKVAGLFTPSEDSGEGSAVSSFFFRYKSSSDGRMAEPGDYTGRGISYIIRLDDGSYRNVQFYVGAEPYSYAPEGNAKNAQQALGNPLKYADSKVKANWKIAEKPKRKKKADLNAESTKKEVAEIPDEVAEIAIEAADIIVDDIIESTPEANSRIIALPAEEIGDDAVSEFIPPYRQETVEIPATEPTADLVSEQQETSTTWTFDDLVPPGDDYVLMQTEFEDGFFASRAKGTVNNFDNLSGDEHLEGKNLLNARSEEIESYDRNIYGWSRKKTDASGRDHYINKKPSLVHIYNEAAIYDFISRIAGVQVDGRFADIYGDDNGSIFVRLKQDIRVDDDGNSFLVDIDDPLWMYMPYMDDEALTENPDDGLSIENAALDTDLADLFDQVDDKGEIPVFSPELVAAAILYDYAELSARRSDAAEAQAGRNIPRTETRPQLLFATSSDRQNIGEEGVADSLAIYTLDRISDTKVRRLYSSFVDRYDKAEAEAIAEFDKENRDAIAKARLAGDIDSEQYYVSTESERREADVQFAVAQEFGADESMSKEQIFRLYISQDNDIAKNISGLSTGNKNMVIDSLAKYLMMGADTYTANAHTIRLALNNPKYLNTGKKLINNMVRAMRTAYGNDYSRKSASFGIRYFTDKKALAAWNKIRQMGKSGNLEKDILAVSEMTDDDFKTLFSALVDPDGLPAGIVNTGEHYTSPLIELVNYLRGYSSGMIADDDSFSYAGDEFVAFSQDMLATRVNELNEERFRNDEDPIPTLHYTNEDRWAIMDLVKLFHSAGGTLADIFNRSTSANFVDALVSGIEDRIKKLKSEQQTARLAITEGEIPELNKQIAASKREISRLERVVRDYQDKNRDLRKENADLSRKIQKIGTENYQETLDRIRQLEADIRSKERKIESIKERYTAQISEYQRQIDQITSSDSYKTAKEIKESYDALMNSMFRAASMGNKRLAVDLTRILNALYSRKKVKLSEDLFRSRYSEYDPILASLRESLINAGIISEEGYLETPVRPDTEIRRGLVVTGLKGMSLDQLSKTVDIFRKARRQGMEIELADSEARLEENRRMELAAIRDIPAFKNSDDAQLDDLIEGLKESSALGSADDESSKKEKLGLVRQARLVAPYLENHFPTLYAMIFGGDTVDGKYSGNNLNTRYDRRGTAVAKRKSALTEKFSELFGYKPQDFNIMAKRVFAHGTYNLGSVSVGDFARKRGFTWGKISGSRKLSVSVSDGIMKHPQYRALADMILRRQKEYLKAQMKLENEKITAEEYAKIEKSYYSFLSGDRDDATYTMEQMMAIYVYSRQAGGLRRLVPDSALTGKSNNIPVTHILWVIDQLENNPDMKPYREFAEYIQKEIASRYEEIAQQYFNITGNILTEEDYYFGLVSLDRDIDPTMDIDGKAPMVNYNIANWFTHDRTGSNTALNLHLIDIASNIIDAQETYINLADMLYSLRSMFANGGDFELAMIDQFGAKGKQTVQMFREWVNAQMSSPMMKDSNISRLIRLMRRNRVFSQLTLNLSTILQQYPTYLLIGTKVGMVDAVRCLFEYIPNKAKMDQLVYSKSGQMLERRRLEQTTMEADLRRLTSERAIEDTSAFLKEHGITDKVLHGKEIIKKMNAWALRVQNSVDGSVANAMWIAAYNHNLETMDQRTLTDAEFDQMCAEDATQTVLNLNPSSNAKDNAAMFYDRDNEIKELVLYTNQLVKQGNLLWNSIDSWWNNKRDLARLGNMIRTLAYIGLVSGLAAFIGGNMLRDDDDEDEWYAWLGRILGATGTEMTGMIPYLGTLIRDGLTGERYADRNIIDNIRNFINVVTKDAEDRREGQLKNAIMYLLGDVSELFGIPFNGPVRKLSNVFNTDDDVLINIFELINSKWGDAFNRWAS